MDTFLTERTVILHLTCSKNKFCVFLILIGVVEDEDVSDMDPELISPSSP